MKINLLQTLNAISEAIDLVNPVFRGHHIRTAYIALSLAQTAGYSADVCRAVFIAAFLHDIGGLTEKERLQPLEYQDSEKNRHAVNGGFMLNSVPLFKEFSQIVRYHHHKWQHGAGRFDGETAVPYESQIVYLADRIDVLTATSGLSNYLAHSQTFISAIHADDGAMYDPELLKIFDILAQKESFWLDLACGDLPQTLMRECAVGGEFIGLHDLRDVSQLLSMVVDVHSNFTVAHSIGVGYIARLLGQLLNYPAEKCLKLEITGFLHDIGKISIPATILEKNGKLTDDEFRKIKEHSYQTFKVLSHIDGMEDIARWAAYHHERLDGKGHPFHLTASQLSTECRVVAFADIFTALVEDRPYRRGLPAEIAFDIILQEVASNHLDPDIYQLAKENQQQLYDEYLRARTWIDERNIAFAMHSAIF